MTELTINQALQQAIAAHKAGKVQEADRLYTAILKAHTKHPVANHNMGVLAVGVGKAQEALPFFRTALEANPNKTQFWLSYIDLLIELNRLVEAQDIFNQAIKNVIKDGRFDELQKKLNLKIRYLVTQEVPEESLQHLRILLLKRKFHEVLIDSADFGKKFPNSGSLYNVIGTAYLSLQQVVEAKECFKKAIVLTPDFFKPYNNISNIYKNEGDLRTAMEYYKAAATLAPNNANIYNNIGNVLQDQGKDEEAIEAFQQALTIEPNLPEAHRNLSNLKKYTSKDDQLLQVERLYRSQDLDDIARCHLSFTLSKAYNDLADYELAFQHLTKGNELRKRELGYTIVKDKILFSKLKRLKPYLIENTIKNPSNFKEVTPIFIVGMPRSGTTLVEQIVSSHSEVTGAGELNTLNGFWASLMNDEIAPSTTIISDFRLKYLLDLTKRGNGKRFVTDKMPQNFRFIALICAAFPDAKIIHVQRDAAATCWSNYKHYFDNDGLGYCYNLQDLLAYYELYFDLMKFWQSSYGDRIYNLNYEKLTVSPNAEIKNLINHLDLTWDDACLAPHKNKRIARTASQQQVKQRIYKDSSKEWRNYEPFLGGVFDEFIKNYNY